MTFYVFTDDLKDSYRKSLSDFINANKCSVHYIDVDVTMFNGLSSTEQYPPLLYCKMIPHLFLPSDVERILYLDLDLIINGDLDDLYNRDLGVNYLSACRGWRAFGANHLNETYSFSVDYDAFNSGVVLYNLVAMRGEISLSSYFSWLNEYKRRTSRAQEQYEEWLMINVMRGRIAYEMPYDYNYNINSHAYQLYERYCEERSIVPLKRIIHYMPFYNEPTIKKPWLYFDVFVYNEEHSLPDRIYGLYKLWWSYAKKTPEHIFALYRTMSEARENING